MPPKKRRTKPRVVTEATKAQLPRPKRKRKPRLPTAEAALKEAFERTRWEPSAPLTATEILKLRERAREEANARAVPCGEDVTTPAGTFTAPLTMEVRVTEVSPNVTYDFFTLSPKQLDAMEATSARKRDWLDRASDALWWVDGRLDAAQRWLAAKLRKLADGVEPT